MDPDSPRASASAKGLSRSASSQRDFAAAIASFEQRSTPAEAIASDGGGCTEEGCVHKQQLEEALADLRLSAEIGQELLKEQRVLQDSLAKQDEANEQLIERVEQQGRDVTLLKNVGAIAFIGRRSLMYLHAATAISP